MRKFRDALLLVILPLLIFAGFLYLLPPVRERVDYRVEELRLKLRYALFPPEEAVFVPQDQVAAAVQATMRALTPPEVVYTQTPTPTFTPGPTQPPTLTPTPTLVPTPIPAAYSIQGVRYVDQHGMYNYCAPANLTMGLLFWGWEGTRTDVGTVLKPFDRDLNVMPYEMADYVTSHTNLVAIWRSGGTQDLLKKLIAAGYPVLVEKGAYMQDLSGKISWMGHYQVITGYDDNQKKFTAQDSYYRPNFPVTYDEMTTGWRAFNNVFILIYPPEKESEVNALLGFYSDQDAAERIALNAADQEKDSLTGIDQYFAWYNRGTSLVRMSDFTGAAAAFDQAFSLYEALPKDKRPWRMLWYQTGPYFAYYYSGRYQDVIDLATLTIDTANNPYLEETYYWRGMALVMLGRQGEAIEDYRKALEYHPAFQPAMDGLTALGYTP